MFFGLSQLIEIRGRNVRSFECSADKENEEGAHTTKWNCKNRKEIALASQNIKNSFDDISRMKEKNKLAAIKIECQRESFPF